MRGLGTIINALAIVMGGVLGILFKRFLKERYQDTIIKATGFSVVFLGAAGTLSKILTVRPDGTLSTGGSMVMILSLALGALLGELIDLDAQFERFGEWLKHKTGSDGDNQFVNGFVSASLTVSIGAMAVIGSIQDGIYGDHSTLVAKAILDFIIVLIMASSMGKGCVFSFIPVAVLQGAMTALAVVLSGFMTDAVLNNLSLVGNILIFCVGINLVWPRTDLRAKPLDELEWEGAGLSARGFRSIVLEVAVNGKKRKEFAPDSLPEQKGTIRFQGFLALEELDVEPFELVSCHLAGQAVTANGTRPVLSTPCFIEVRPFREDVLTPDQIPDFANKRKMFEAHASITLILENQLELNKLLFTAKILLARGSMKEHENAYSELRSGQISLAKELDVLLGDPESRFMPADAVNHLESAYSAMRNAAELLEKKDLDRASAAQQTAIAELIQSLKSTKKVLLPRGSGNESKQPEPFRDDQEFKVPPMPDSENPDRKLAELVKRQEELLRKMKEVQTDPQELAERQNVLRKDAVQLAPQRVVADGAGVAHGTQDLHLPLAADELHGVVQRAFLHTGTVIVLLGHG